MSPATEANAEGSVFSVPRCEMVQRLDNAKSTAKSILWQNLSLPPSLLFSPPHCLLSRLFTYHIDETYVRLPPHNASGVTRAIVLSPPTNPPTQTPSYSTHFPFTPQHFSTLVINLGPNNPLLPLQQHPNNQTTQPINHSFIHSNLCTDTTLIVPTQFTVSGPYLARPCSTILYLNHHHHQTSLFIHFFPSLTSFSILSFFPSHISASAQCSDPMWLILCIILHHNRHTTVHQFLTNQNNLALKNPATLEHFSRCSDTKPWVPSKCTTKRSPFFSVAERERCGNVYSAQEQGEKQTRVGQSSSLVMMVQYFKK